MNLFHDISAGTKESMTVIIEIPRGAKNKYEIDKEVGIIALDRVMYTAQDYPFDYGFIPKTLWDDGDGLDVILLTTYPLAPSILVHSRPIGILHMTDSGENDNKILAVPVADPRFEHVKDIGDVNKHTLKEIEHFFTTYKQLQDKEVLIDGFGDKKEAETSFERSVKMYADSPYSKRETK